MAILKLKDHDENKEIQFEIDQFLKMKINNRFRMMFEKSKLMREIMEKHGFTQTPEIIKRK